MNIANADRMLRIDEALDDMTAEREWLLARPSSPERSERLAELWEREAGCWQALFDLATNRPHWRAALIAEVHARRAARYWRHRSMTEALDWPMSVVFGGRSSAERLEAALLEVAS